VIREAVVLLLLLLPEAPVIAMAFLLLQDLRE
jgi:hypothetical protein